MSVAQRSMLSFLRSRTGWIGIDIGTHSLKLAQVESVGGQKQIAHALVIPLPAASHLTAESVRTGWLTRALRTALPCFRGRTAACGVSMSVTDFRSMNIPPGSRNERREMIAQELIDGGIATAEAIEFDFWDGNPKEENAAVNVLAVSKSFVTQVAEAIQGAGLNCRALDGSPFTLARSLELMNHDSVVSTPRAVLDWGHRVAHLAIVVDGLPAFSRVLKDCEVGPLVESIAQGLGLSLEDSCELLSTYGVPDPQGTHSEFSEIQELVVDMAAELFDQLTVEVDKTLQYLGSHRPELAPTELVLLGGGAAIRNAEAKLSQEFNLPVMRWQLPLRRMVGMTGRQPPVELFANAAALSDLGCEP